MRDRFPDRDARILLRRPAGFDLLPVQQLDLARPGDQHTRIHQPIDAGILRPRQYICHAELALVEAELFKPVDAEARSGIYIALGFGKIGVKLLVDELQRRADRQRRTVGFEHPTVTAVHRHTRPDGRLRQVHRGDAARLHLAQCSRQFAAQCVDELAA